MKMLYPVNKIEYPNRINAVRNLHLSHLRVRVPFAAGNMLPTRVWIYYYRILSEAPTEFVSVQCAYTDTCVYS